MSGKLTTYPSLHVLQLTIQYQQLIRIFNGHWQGAAFLHSIACRIVCSLGGHVEKPIQSQPHIPREDRETSHIRSLFWVCYMLDKDISLRTGTPPILTAIDCDLTCPDSALNRFAHFGPSSAPPETTSPGIPYFTYLISDPRLSVLKEKVYRQLFSAHALKENDNQLLLHIRHLDEEIESWRLSIAPSLRPALSVPPDTAQPTLGILDTTRRMSLQLEYHYLMTVIHTTVRRCTADAPDGIRDLHDVVHSSFDLSLEASRSTLWCLQSLTELTGAKAIR